MLRIIRIVHNSADTSSSSFRSSPLCRVTWIARDTVGGARRWTNEAAATAAAAAAAAVAAAAAAAACYNLNGGNIVA